MRIALSSLLLVTLIACGSEDADSGGAKPHGLPTAIPYGSAQYNNPRIVLSLPPDVEKTGGELRGGGVVYRPPGATSTPASIWVVKDGKVWQYSVEKTR